MKTQFIKTMLMAGIPFGFMMGFVFSFSDGMPGGVIGGILCGVLFGAFMGGFSELQRRKMEIPTDELDGMDVLFQGPANHFLKGEGRGGWLTLTPDLLRFRSHGKNLQNQPLEISLEDVDEAIPVRTIGIIPNGLQVRLKNNENQNYVVQDRNFWIRMINQQLTSISGI